jgi:ABC-2 type transport system ATP-binding protein
MQMSHEPLVELKEVRKKFGRIVALDGLDLHVRAGELLAVLGPNGAGKTTAISLMLGLQRPDTGSVSLFGRSPHLFENRRQIGVMMQEVFLSPELRVREHIDLVASYYSSPMAPDEVLEYTRTTPLRNRPYGKLSGGQKRQAQFAMAVCGRPKLLFLDEPTAGLDVQARELMWSTLRRLIEDGASIVLTTHYLEEAEALADRVAVVNKGRLIASGSVNEIRAVVSRKHLSCVTALTVQEVQAWPEVESATRDRLSLRIVADNAESVVRKLLTADPNLQDLEIRRAGLAEAFTELTQEAA